MKNKRAIDLLLVVHNEICFGDTTRIDQKDEYLEAIDHAINCVGAIEQIKWERDIAIQQLNELGYQFGEKIRSGEECVKSNVIEN